MASNHIHREIRPATERDFNSASTSELNIDSRPSSYTSTLASRPVRRNVLVACQGCKKRKIKCPAERPKCSSCMTKGIECHYDAGPSESRSASLKRRYEEMERRNDRLEEFVAAIRSMPEEHSLEVLKMIRSGASTENVLSQIQEGYLLLQLSARPKHEPVRRDMPDPTLTAIRGFLVTPEASPVASGRYWAASSDSKPPPSTPEQGLQDFTSEQRLEPEPEPEPQSRPVSMVGNLGEVREQHRTSEGMSFKRSRLSER